MSQVLGDQLGVVWDLDRLREAKEKNNASKGGDKPSKMFIPLSVAIRPEILEKIEENLGPKKSTLIAGGDYVPHKNEEIKPLAEMSPADFKKYLKSAGLPGVKT